MTPAARVLVTGGRGFIGRQTLEPLLRRGFEVHATASGGTRADVATSSAGHEASIRWHEADLHDPHAADNLVADVAPSHLLHLAWDAEPGRFWTSEANLLWVESSLRLLRAFAARGGERAVIAGTCAEYAWTRRTHCVEGETPLGPATLYGASKHALHVIAEQHSELAGYALCWGRVFLVFGPGESTERLGGSVASALVEGRPAQCSHGEQVRDFLASPDLGDAFAALVDSSVTGPVNLGSGTPIRIRDLVAALGEASGRPDLVRLGELPAPANEPSQLTAAVHRLHDEVGWVPGASLEQRARETIAWWQAQSGSEAPDRPAPSARAIRR